RSLELRAERDAVRAARVVVCNSERSRRDVIEKVGANPARARVVYYGTDPTQFCPATPDERAEARGRLDWPADRPVVIFVGSPRDRRKGFDTLLAAWSRLCQSADWDALLVVVGHGTGLASDRVRFLGFR